MMGAEWAILPLQEPLVMFGAANVTLGLWCLAVTRSRLPESVDQSIGVETSAPTDQHDGAKFEVTTGEKG